MHREQCPDQFYGCWSSNSRNDASGLLQAITQFDFIMAFVCAHICLSHMIGITVKLQKKTNDIYKAFTMVSDVAATYQNIRMKLDEHFEEIFDAPVAMAAKVAVVPGAPRVVGRQEHRLNAPAVSTKEY